MPRIITNLRSRAKSLNHDVHDGARRETKSLHYDSTELRGKRKKLNSGLEFRQFLSRKKFHDFVQGVGIRRMPESGRSDAAPLRVNIGACMGTLRTRGKQGHVRKRRTMRDVYRSSVIPTPFTLTSQSNSILLFRILNQTICCTRRKNEQR